jgi:beta-glucanase (GH16 family)
MERRTGAAAGMFINTTVQAFLPNGEHFSEAFHLFSVDWQEDHITWYMDDQEYYSITSNQMNGQPYPFNDSFFFIMNIAVGGDWPGYPDASPLLFRKK